MKTFIKAALLATTAVCLPLTAQADDEIKVSVADAQAIGFDFDQDDLVGRSGMVRVEAEDWDEAMAAYKAANASAGEASGAAQQAAEDAASVTGITIEQTNSADITGTLNLSGGEQLGEISATAAAIGNSLSVVTGGSALDLSAVQANTAGIDADLSLDGGFAGADGSLNATAAGIANSLSADLGTANALTATQTNEGTVTGDLSASEEAASIGAKALSVTAAAIANSASVTGGVAEDAVSLNQATSGDVTGTLSLGIESAETGADGSGVAQATVAAIGNSFSGDYTGGVGGLQLTQDNQAQATATGTVRAVSSDVAVTAAAIGNSASVNVGVNVQ
jgi:hypothetical protein